MVRKGSPVRVRQRALRVLPASAANPEPFAARASSLVGPQWVRNRDAWCPVESTRGRRLVHARGRSGAPRATDLVVAQLSLPFASEPSDPRPDYLTIAEAAASLRCCERTIRRAIARGALRAGKVRGGEGSRGAYRIRRADLEHWLFSDDGAR